MGKKWRVILYLHFFFSTKMDCEFLGCQAGYGQQIPVVSHGKSQQNAAGVVGGSGCREDPFLLQATSQPSDGLLPVDPISRELRQIWHAISDLNDAVQELLSALTEEETSEHLTSEELPKRCTSFMTHLEETSKSSMKALQVPFKLPTKEIQLQVPAQQWLLGTPTKTSPFSGP